MISHSRSVTGSILSLVAVGSNHVERGRRQMYYALRVQGHLDPSWSDRFGGLRIEQQEAGTTLLSGSLPDQAALHGLLLQIVRLGLVLLSLETSVAKGAAE